MGQQNKQKASAGEVRPFDALVSGKADWDDDYNAQRIKFLKKLQPDELLCELLAGLHGDGGQHTDKVGLLQSMFDAEQKMEGRKEFARQKCKRQREICAENYRQKSFESEMTNSNDLILNAPQPDL